MSKRSTSSSSAGSQRGRSATTGRFLAKGTEKRGGYSGSTPLAQLAPPSRRPTSPGKKKSA